MKIREYSDLHLDWFAGAFNAKSGEPILWYPPEMPDDKETVLMLAGDLWVGTKFIEFAGHSWISKVAARFKQVLIVLGNHDYWPDNHSLSIKSGADKCNALMQDHGIYNALVLDSSTWESEGIVFVGNTLWTDMDKFNPLAMMNMSQFMRYDGKIAYETSKEIGFSRFTSEKWVQTHLKHKSYIDHVAKNNKDKKIVVMTHHLPLTNMGDPCYANDSSNAYYMSDLSELLLSNDNIVFWTCGHSHYSNDFMFPSYTEAGDGCRMYMNPVGYTSEHREQEGLVKHEVIEL